MKYKKTGKENYFISDTNHYLLRSCVELNSPALLIGETGTGKTSIIRELAKENSKELIRVSVNGSMGVEEILGKWLVNKGTTVWQDGILTMAMRAGHWVVMDEINAALPEILFVLHSLLDDDRKIILPEKDNEIVHPHGDFRFFATMNPPEEYAGTKDMNKALMSRFTAILQVEVLSSIDEAKLLVSRGADLDLSSRLVTLATVLRKHKSEESIFYFCSTRDLLHCVALVNSGVNLSDAVIGSVVNKMHQKEYEVVKSEFKDILGKPKVELKVTIDELVTSYKNKEKEIENAKKDAKLEYEKKLALVAVASRSEIEREMSDKIRSGILEKISGALREK